MALAPTIGPTMTYAAILTHVQIDSDTAPRLACAVDMAEKFRAALIGVGAEMIPPLAFDGGVYSVQADWATAMRETIEENLAGARKTFVSAARELGARAVWCSGIELPTPAVAAASRAADLIVAGGAPRRRRDSYREASAADLALTSGRPVLVAPSQGPALKAERIVLAWKDTREARRALSDALPFFEQAELVEVVEICHASDIDQAVIRVEDVVGALKRRGVRAAAKVVEHAHGAPDALLQEALKLGADLVVAGCYGHSRLGEWVFGGFTERLIEQDCLYVLLSH